MTCSPPRSPLTAFAGAAALGLLLVGCAAPQDPPPEHSAPASEGDGHGQIAGAAEAPEPPLHLVSIDASGAVALLDLLDGTETTLDAVHAPRAVTTDGRYAFVADHRGVDIIDSGAWTWDHVDHFHYYRAAPGMPGSVSGDGVATIATGMLSTAGETGIFFPGSGDAVLLDNAALSEGSVTELLRIETPPHAGLIAPLGAGALVTEPGPDGTVERLRAVDGAGDEIGTIACAAASGTITTRIALVVGCADGAVLATARDDGSAELTKVAYPDGAAPPATEFSARKGRPTVAGLGTGSGVWLLDTRAQEWAWTALPERPLAATAVDDEADHLVTLAPDGSVRVLDTSGTELAATGQLVEPRGVDTAGGDPQRLTLSVDAQRAYVNAPEAGVVHEIDYADGARIARSLSTAVAPNFFAETGR